MDRIATVGTFDGVHRGHRLVLEALRRAAAERGLAPAALVLREHPLMLIAPERAPLELCSYAEKADFIEDLGVEVLPISFTEETRCLTSRQFMERLRAEHGVRALLVGYDNRFGSDRSATLADYRREGREIGMEVIEAPELRGISSTAVRRAVAEGRVQDAAAMLGRPYTVPGTVTRGAQVGSKIGFPTANLCPANPRQLWPAPGAYATRVRLDGEGPLRPAMTNVGYRPTIDPEKKKISMESHIFGISEPLYGRRIEVQFASRLRAERRFDNLEALQAQLRADRDRAMQILTENR